MKSDTITFSGSLGDPLAARLDYPDDSPPSQYALFAHCFTCSKNLKAVARISRALVDEGLGVMRFDFTGLGESEGDFADTNFSSNVEDLVAAADHMKAEYEAPALLIGHSLGGAAVLRAGSEIESVRAVATIAAPFDPEHVTALLSHALDEVESKGEAEVSVGGRPFTIRKQFLEDLQSAKPKEWVRALGKALLILHSPTDNTVGIDNAAHIFEAARHPKSFVSLDDADHLLTRAADARYAGALIATWATRYI